ncbi:MAG: hypothetical protein Q7R52_04325 [archaeon]|nr:hypothetical protein [archaeon]
MEEEKEIKKIILEIQENYRERYNLKTDKAIFDHLLKQIERHIGKLNKLKDNEDIPGRFKREIADMYLLSLGLIELEKVDDDIIKASADYYLKKTKGEIN